MNKSFISNLINSLLIIACVGDFIVPYTLGIFVPDYKHMDSVMSKLGSFGNKLSLIYNSWLVLYGLIFVCYAIYWFAEYKDVDRVSAIISSSLLMLFGLGCGILAGILHEKPNTNSSLVVHLHNVFLVVGFMGFLAFPIIIMPLIKMVERRVLPTVAIGIFVTGIVLFILFIMSERECFAGTIIGKTGLWQRLLFANYYLLPVLMSLSKLSF